MSTAFIPDPEREDREWTRLTCSCGTPIGATNGTHLRIRHRDRRHGTRAVFSYWDVTAHVPVRIAEIPDTTGQREDEHHGR